MKLTKKLLIILILLIPKIGYAKTYLGEFNYNNDNNIDNKTFNNESIDKSNIVISGGKKLHEIFTKGKCEIRNTRLLFKREFTLRNSKRQYIWI